MQRTRNLSRSRLTKVLALALVTALAGLGTIADARACTTFLLDRGSRFVVAKNYDWHMGQGLVLINHAGVAKQALPTRPGERLARWVSRYRSLTFNQYGREAPNGGMNEAGLVVEIMWLDSSVYSPPDDRPAINELQWIQYQLDRFATVAEVAAHAPKLRVSPINARVHYLVCDKKRECAAFEYLDGQLVISRGAGMPVRVLTNNTYRESIDYLSKHVGFGGKRAPQEGPRSLDRFVRACALTTAPLAGSGDPIQDAFHILERVSQGDFTQWSIVYDPAHLTVSFRSQKSPLVKRVRLGAFTGPCGSPVKMLDLHTTAPGDVTGRFHDYRPIENRRLLERSLARLLEHLPPGFLDKLASYPDSLPCAPAGAAQASGG